MVFFFINYIIKDSIYGLWLNFFCLTMKRSRIAKSGGKSTRIIIVAHNVPSEIDEQIVAAIAVAMRPTIAVTIIKIEADVRIAPIDLL